MVSLGRASPRSGRRPVVEGSQQSSYAARAAFEVDGSSQSSVGGPSVACLKDYSQKDVTASLGIRKTFLLMGSFSFPA